MLPDRVVGIRTVQERDASALTPQPRIGHPQLEHIGPGTAVTAMQADGIGDEPPAWDSPRKLAMPFRSAQRVALARRLYTEGVGYTPNRPQAGLLPPSMWLSQVGCRSAPSTTCSCDRPRAGRSVGSPVRGDLGSDRGAMPGTLADKAAYDHRVELRYPVRGWTTTMWNLVSGARDACGRNGRLGSRAPRHSRDAVDGAMCPRCARGRVLAGCGGGRRKTVAAKAATVDQTVGAGVTRHIEALDPSRTSA